MLLGISKAGGTLVRLDEDAAGRVADQLGGRYARARREDRHDQHSSAILAVLMYFSGRLLSGDRGEKYTSVGVTALACFSRPTIYQGVLRAASRAESPSGVNTGTGIVGGIPSPS